jgi:hypothetical protein
MAISALARFAGAVVAATVAAGATLPAQATSDTLTIMTAPRWVDQTVYRPDCRNIERDCGCRFDSYGQPNCGWW